MKSDKISWGHVAAFKAFSLSLHRV